MLVFLKYRCYNEKNYIPDAWLDICGNSTSVRIPASSYMGESKAEFFNISVKSINFHATALGKQSKNVCMVLKSKILKYKAHSYSKQEIFRTDLNSHFQTGGLFQILCDKHIIYGE